jgi:hypothetical protein
LVTRPLGEFVQRQGRAPGGGTCVAMLEAKRTLVKSGPELWAEVSDPEALARHLAPFGPVRIARAQPETLVAWEGETASGAIALEESGFGTRVVMTAEVAVAEPPPPPEPEPAPRPGLWARLLRRRAPEPQAAPPPPEPLMADTAALQVLTDALDALGRAHHRPFSRA